MAKKKTKATEEETVKQETEETVKQETVKPGILTGCLM